MTNSRSHEAHVDDGGIFELLSSLELELGCFVLDGQQTDISRSHLVVNHLVVVSPVRTLSFTPLYVLRPL